jgi:hypothetical protein
MVIRSLLALSRLEISGKYNEQGVTNNSDGGLHKTAIRKALI